MDSIQREGGKENMAGLTIPPGTKSIVIKKGENLSQIATARSTDNGKSVLRNELDIAGIKANGITNLNNIVAGRRLDLPA